MPKKKKPCKITKAMESLYLKRSGLRCLFCGSTEIEGDRPDIDGPIGWANVRCNECGRGWVDRFDMLTGACSAEEP